MLNRQPAHSTAWKFRGQANAEALTRMQERKAAKLANKGKPKSSKDKALAAEQGGQEPSTSAATSAVTQPPTDSQDVQSSVDRLNGHTVQEASSSSPASPEASCEAATTNQEPQHDEAIQHAQLNGLCWLGSPPF